MNTPLDPTATWRTLRTLVRGGLVATCLASTAAWAQDPPKKPPFADPPKTGEAAKADGEKKGPPFADKSDAPAVEPKPERRTWNAVTESEAGKMAFTFESKPGVPDVDQVVELVISANAIPKRPDPVFGSTVPLVDARLVLEATNPAGQLVSRTVAHALPQAKGRYGVHFTAAQEGIYTLRLRGKTAKGEVVDATMKLPVKTWPLPEDMKGTGDKLNELGGRKGPLSGQ